MLSAAVRMSVVERGGVAADEANRPRVRCPGLTRTRLSLTRRSVGGAECSRLRYACRLSSERGRGRRSQPAPGSLSWPHADTPVADASAGPNALGCGTHVGCRASWVAAEANRPRVRCPGLTRTRLSLTRRRGRVLSAAVRRSVVERAGPRLTKQPASLSWPHADTPVADASAGPNALGCGTHVGCRASWVAAEANRPRVRCPGLTRTRLSLTRRRGRVLSAAVRRSVVERAGPRLTKQPASLSWPHADTPVADASAGPNALGCGTDVGCRASWVAAEANRPRVRCPGLTPSLDRGHIVRDGLPRSRFAGHAGPARVTAARKPRCGSMTLRCARPIRPRRWRERSCTNMLFRLDVVADADGSALTSFERRRAVRSGSGERR